MARLSLSGANLARANRVLGRIEPPAIPAVIDQGAENGQTEPGLEGTRNARAAALIETWRASYPATFCDPPRPLKIGIGDELLDTFDAVETRKVIKLALTHWTRQTVYLQALADGGPRHALDGSISGEVTSDQQAHAHQRLLERAELQAPGSMA